MTLGTGTPPSSWGSWENEHRATTPRQRFAAGAGILLASTAIVGACVWAATDPADYGRSHDGCVTVTLASSTGGAMRHECGQPARDWCRSAYADSDHIAMLTRPQCQLAGLTPAAVSAAP